MPLAAATEHPFLRPPAIARGRSLQGFLDVVLHVEWSGLEMCISEKAPGLENGTWVDSGSH